MTINEWLRNVDDILAAKGVNLDAQMTMADAGQFLMDFQDAKLLRGCVLFPSNLTGEIGEDGRLVARSNAYPSSESRG